MLRNGLVGGVRSRLLRSLSQLGRIGHGLLDLVYPMRCLVCESSTETGALCEKCVAAFEPIPEPQCTLCGRPLEIEPCGSCARWTEETGMPRVFDAARAAAIYGGPLRAAIHHLKYDGKENLGAPLGAFLANRLVADGLLVDHAAIDAVAFVPMRPSRERARGYNQARLLAEPVAALLGVPLLGDRDLRRAQSGLSQAGLSDRARRSNVAASAFTARASPAITGKRILLIDDVFTTGATVSACAAALKQAGAAYVAVATLSAGG